MDIYEIQDSINLKLADLFNKNGIKNFRLTSLGNSIATGYSIVRTTKPLLARNESLNEIMSSNGIAVETNSVARPQDNNDEHIFEWLSTNKTVGEINKMVQHDFANTRTSRPPIYGLNQQEVKEAYPSDNNARLQDLLKESNADLANVVIYNGATGSFLDGITRNGTLRQKLTYGITRDLTSIESTLKWIQSQNRDNNSNTQVYLCGVPDFLGLGLSAILINNRLKKIAEEYANVVYVEPLNSKFFYDKYNNEEKPAGFIGKLFDAIFQGKRVDVHYDEEEYIKFSNDIFESILENYIPTQALINLDRRLCGYNNYLQFINEDEVDYKKVRNEKISKMIDEEISKIENPTDRIKFLKLLKKYMVGRFPYDFYYLNKRDTLELIKEKGRKAA